MVASYLGIEPAGPKQSASLEEAAEFIPSQRLSKQEFDDVLRKHGLPVKE